METLNLLGQRNKKNTVYIIATNDQAVVQGLIMSEWIRSAYPKIEVLVNTAGGSFKNQFKKADKSGARLALILGEDELANEQISVKDLRNETEQITVDQNMINQVLKDYLE